MADKTRVFKMTPDTAAMFFVLVKWSVDHGVEDTVELRNYILNWLGSNDRMLSVYDTTRGPDQVVEDLREHGFKIDDQRPKEQTKAKRLWKFCYYANCLVALLNLGVLYGIYFYASSISYVVAACVVLNSVAACYAHANLKDLSSD